MITPCYKIISIEELERMSTKNLISLMRKYEFEKPDSDYDCYEGNCKCQTECWKVRDKMIMKIYEILKNRPHLLNKIEAKQLRQKRAKERFKHISAR